MEASLNYELAVYLSWIAGVCLLVPVPRVWPDWWHTLRPIQFEKPRREALWGLTAAAALIFVSVASDQWLRPWKQESALRPWVNLGQLAVVYSPIAIILFVRKQGLDTCFLRLEKLPQKMLVGLLASLAASAAFLSVRGEIGGYAKFVTALSRGGLVAMSQTFLEGLAVGFLLYRFAAWLGAGWSLLLVAILFMAAHIPNYTAGTFNLPLPQALLMAAAHAGIAIVVLGAVWKTQDIVAIGFLHWFINAASDFSTTA